MTETINPQIFREYDIRGLVDKDLTPSSTERITLQVKIARNPVFAAVSIELPKE